MKSNIELMFQAEAEKYKFTKRSRGKSSFKTLVNIMATYFGVYNQWLNKFEEDHH